VTNSRAETIWLSYSGASKLGVKKAEVIWMRNLLTSNRGDKDRGQVDEGIVTSSRDEEGKCHVVEVF
jgi:hypothetical protein